MREVPPNRRRVTDQECGDAGGEGFDRERQAQQEQNPKRDDEDQEQLHTPEGNAAREAEEKNVARARGCLALDDQKQNDERRYEQEIKCVAARLKMPLEQTGPEREDERSQCRDANRVEALCHQIEEREANERQQNGWDL